MVGDYHISNLVCLCVSFPLNFICFCGWSALVFRLRHSELTLLKWLSVIPAVGNLLWMCALTLFYFTDLMWEPVVADNISSNLALNTFFVFSCNNWQLSFKLQSIVHDGGNQRSRNLPRAVMLFGILVINGICLYGCLPGTCATPDRYQFYVIASTIMHIVSTLILADAFCRIHRQTKFIANTVANLKAMGSLMLCYLLYTTSAFFFTTQHRLHGYHPVEYSVFSVLDTMTALISEGILQVMFWQILRKNKIGAVRIETAPNCLEADSDDENELLTESSRSRHCYVRLSQSLSEMQESESSFLHHLVDNE